MSLHWEWLGDPTAPKAKMQENQLPLEKAYWEETQSEQIIMQRFTVSSQSAFPVSHYCAFNNSHYTVQAEINWRGCFLAWICVSGSKDFPVELLPVVKDRGSNLCRSSGGGVLSVGFKGEEEETILFVSVPLPSRSPSLSLPSDPLHKPQDRIAQRPICPSEIMRPAN